MKILVTGVAQHDLDTLIPALTKAGHDIETTSDMLSLQTVQRAQGFEAVVTFVCDDLSAAVINALAAAGVKLIAQRAAGVDNIDLAAAHQAGIQIARIPAYSPYAVAEQAVALLLSLNRHIPHAYQRVLHGNFSLQGLRGFDLHGKTVLVVGTGRIGQAFTRIMQGFGCVVLAYDPAMPVAHRIPQIEYIDELADGIARARIISLHCPLLPETRHIINAAMLENCHPDTILINTSRGAVVDTAAVLAALKQGHLAAYGADVYENESCLFFRDCSITGYEDTLLKELLTLPNVLLTPHQAFFTIEALEAIAAATVQNLTDYSAGRRSGNFL
ncbi:NAD(P)-dependent oxidoreductase [Sulfuriferula nivalis]|uniref:Lactate dehydrogenase n=1 Tax=Sulfuriferula nivalis TaxID=2675298 RepID=A0A809RNY8_9PROT|nr:NAD(P)-dependent oxidoreductase [Sulfuriferula nivalis]BBP00531.1 lactate dehydrogenase [Sulfuriferula nivalis]